MALADGLRQKGDYDEAAALNQQAAALFVEVLGHDHMAAIKTCRGDAVSYMDVAGPTRTRA